MQSKEESKEYHKKYYRDHIEQWKKYDREYYKAHAEEKRECQRRWNKNNTEKVRQRHRKENKERGEEFRKWKEFAGPCAKCGNGDARVLEFHHTDPRKKKFDIARGWYRSLLTELIDELAKCIVLCANCHKIEEHENGAWK